MKQSIKLTNLGMVFVTVACVLQIRMETASISYDLSKKSHALKVYEKNSKLLSAKYEYEVGSERMVSEADSMVALSAPKVDQIVMIDKSGLAITR